MKCDYCHKEFKEFEPYTILLVSGYNLHNECYKYVFGNKRIDNLWFRIKNKIKYYLRIIK